jgi:toxin FitB
VWNIESPARARFAAALSALESRFSDRILSVGDEGVRRWGVISGTLKRRIGHSLPVIDSLLAARQSNTGSILLRGMSATSEDSDWQRLQPMGDDPGAFPLE